MEGVQPQDVIEVIGRFGLYHALVLTVAVLRAIPIAWTYMMSPLMAPEVPHECAPPDGFNETKWRAFAQPDECSAIPLAAIFNGSDFYEALSGTERQPCEFGWRYDMKQFGPTATSEWNLVCADSWMRSGLQAMIMAGSLSGVTIFGKCADTFGRKKTFYGGILLAAVIGILGTFAPSLFWFNASRFVVASCAAGITASIVTLFMEIMPNTDRVMMNVGFGIGYVVPVVLIGLMSWTFQNFRLMQFALGISFLLVIPFYPFMEESPKWLLAKGRTEEAARSMKRILHRSRRSIPNLDKIMRNLSLQVENEKRQLSKQLSLADLFLSTAIRPSLLATFALWFCESITYYHIMLNAHKFGGNPQFYYAISASAEIPAALIGIWVCRRVGRRLSQVIPLLLSGFSFGLVLALMPSTAVWPNIIAIMWIRFLLKSQNFTQWIAVHENFPTPVRSTGFSVCHMFSRTGAALAPFIVDLGRATHPAIPHAIFFISAFVECICVYKMPETLHEALPDTLEALEEICKKSYSKSRENFPFPKEVLLETESRPL